MAKLFLIPTTLANTINGNSILINHLPLIQHLQYFIVETAKIARQHLKHLNLAQSLQNLHISELNKHQKDLASLIQPLLAGHDMGLLSDCGLPAIADPGGSIVNLAHQHKIEVIPLVGPSSLMLALMSSGVNGQSFAFNGYIPINHNERITKIKQLQDLIIQSEQSQIIIETPFRNQQLFESLLSILTDAQIIISLAINLMNENQTIISRSLKEWKQQIILPNLHKQEVVFVIGLPQLIQ
ncbi:MAG: rRNA (cytidine1402-2-O)-methyltransferase [Pseudomonadota bacterium]|nr:rRNA (cytidine1402-2-O)-methyltransferase [Pseudomonadota bacterium]